MIKWWCSATANHEKSFCNLDFSFFNLQFAFLNLHFAFLDFRFPSCIYEKGSCQLRQLPSNQPFFLISEMTSSIKDKAFSLLFSSTKVLIANSSVSSSHRVMFCCFIPSHLLCMQPELHILWYTKYNMGENKMLTIHIFYYISPLHSVCTLYAHYMHSMHSSYWSSSFATSLGNICTLSSRINLFLW